MTPDSTTASLCTQARTQRFIHLLVYGEMSVLALNIYTCETLPSHIRRCVSTLYALSLLFAVMTMEWM
jgi:hypothetical protein